MKTYLYTKLSDIILRISFHPEAANKRLSSECYNILLLPRSSVPAEFLDEFDELINLFKEEIKRYGHSHPTKLSRIRNKTAVRYIKLLHNIHYHLDHTA